MPSPIAPGAHLATMARCVRKLTGMSPRTSPPTKNTKIHMNIVNQHLVRPDSVRPNRRRKHGPSLVTVLHCILMVAVLAGLVHYATLLTVLFFTLPIDTLPCNLSTGMVVLCIGWNALVLVCAFIINIVLDALRFRR